jgi:hypothetical protein
MSDTPPPGTPPTDESTGPRPPWDAAAFQPNDRVRVLAQHFHLHSRTHTPEALGRAALGAGYSQVEVAAAIASVEARLASAEASAPTRSTAKRAILAAYGLTYLVFAIVFLTQPFSYGAGVIALVILTVVLGLALGLSALWYRRRRWLDEGAGLKVGAILSLPVVLLVIVAGTCAWTTFPSLNR